MCLLDWEVLPWLAQELKIDPFQPWIVASPVYDCFVLSSACSERKKVAKLLCTYNSYQCQKDPAFHMYTVWQQLKPHLISKCLFQNNNPQSNLKTSQIIVVIAVSVVRLFSKLQGFHYQRNLVFPALLRSSLPTFRRSSSTAFRWFDNFNLSDWSLTFSLFCCSTWPFTSQKWGPPRMDHSIFQNESWLATK